MTAFFTRLSRNAVKAALLLACTFFLTTAQGASIEPVRAELLPTEDGYSLSAVFRVELGPRVEEAVVHGTPLYFNLELEVLRPRWYWINEHVADHSLTYRLSYHALTQEYRLATGGLVRRFSSLRDAVAALSRISALPVFDRTDLKPGEPYQGAVRLSFDRSKLPKPFQVDAIVNQDWQIDSKVMRWNFQVSEREVK